MYTETGYRLRWYEVLLYRLLDWLGRLVWVASASLLQPLWSVRYLLYVERHHEPSTNHL